MLVAPSLDGDHVAGPIAHVSRSVILSTAFTFGVHTSPGRDLTASDPVHAGLMLRSLRDT
ncbi:hypothetical protein GCM10010411_13460 [Actinomadura fulvescens]|uniref:Tetracyclin repressor-like C-terminal domain-containing protein n=1 Tax=Actinomadura fulvescens TaxID=46160 RepID=A0ABP6BQV6_9ACTN